MTNLEIRDAIQLNNELIKKMLDPSKFVLNNAVQELMLENKKLQDQCTHEWEDGICVYCNKIKSEE